MNSGDRTFQYSFTCGSDRSAVTLKAPINVEELRRKDVPEFCARLLNHHRIPCFVEDGIVSSMKKYVETQLTELKNKNSAECIRMIRQNSDSISKMSQTIAEKYEKTCVQYAKPQESNVNDFPLAYHYLIHSAAMQIVLKLEAKYQSSLSKLIVNKDQSLVKMQERQQLEMARMCENVGFAFTNKDVTELASKQLIDVERLIAHWDNEYESTIVKQRDEFRQVVINFHREMQQNNDKILDSGPAYNRIKQIIDQDVTVSASYSRNTVDEDTVSQISSPNVSSLNGSSGVLMEESFTINLGAQLKTMHNVRLAVTDMLGFCHYYDEREREAQRFQSAMSLYSNSLSALVLFTDKRLGYQTGLQKEFSTICHSSTEFHFDSLSDQLSKIQKLVSDKRRGSEQDNAKTGNQEEGYLHLEEGDFYITKHSNLSQVHVVFHLVADENSLHTKASLANVTSRHPVVLSLRQILKVCSSYDIGTITLPLLLTHELTEEITFQWCVKRAELVMKCVKGFMMEMATWDGGVSRTIQFVVPPGISEEAFDRMRSNLPEVFRTTSTRDLTRTRPSR